LAFGRDNEAHERLSKMYLGFKKNTLQDALKLAASHSDSDSNLPQLGLED